MDGYLWSGPRGNVEIGQKQKANKTYVRILEMYACCIYNELYWS